MVAKSNEILSILPLGIRSIFQKLNVDYKRLYEIRLRVNKTLAIYYDNREVIPDETFIVMNDDIRECIEYVSNYSLYAYEEELGQGFITVNGGHRVGIVGKVVLENGEIKTIKYISGINIRVSHQVYGCSDNYIQGLVKDSEILSTLIISPPGCGKTTFLRDLIYYVSEGNTYLKGENVSVVDERGELAACYKGAASNNLGRRTDVLDGCPKSQGMLMLLRSMNPRVMAVDEIGEYKDIQAIEYIANAGCDLLCTIHGKGINDILKKKELENLMEKGIFKRFIVLKKGLRPGIVDKIYNEELNVIYEADRWNIDNFSK